MTGVFRPQIAVYVGDDEGPFSGFQLVFTGTIDQPVFAYDATGEASVTFSLRDKAKRLDVPIQNNLYQGTNSGASGFEGLPTDLQGKPKPLCFGECYNVTPALCNASTLTYQVHDGAIQDVVAVYDMGVAITTFTKDLANGRFTLTAAPAGQVTCDVLGAKPAGVYADKVGDLAALVAGGYGGQTVDAYAVTLLNINATGKVGIYIKEPQTIAEVLDELLGSVRGYWLINAADVFTFGQLSTSPSPLAYFTDVDLVECSHIESSDGQGNIPAYQVELSYLKNYTVQKDGDLAGSVPAARRAQLREEYQKKVVTDTSVKTVHLLSPIIRRNTLLVSNYAYEANALASIYKVHNQFVRLVVPFTAANAAIGLGDVVKVTAARFGIMRQGNGKKFAVTSVSHFAPSLHLIELEVWG